MSLGGGGGGGGLSDHMVATSHMFSKAYKTNRAFCPLMFLATIVNKTAVFIQGISQHTYEGHLESS